MSQIIFPSAIPVLSIGGRVFTDLTNLKILHSGAAGAVNGYSAPRLASASAGYAVPAGKSFKVMAVVVQINLALANTYAILGYQDTDVGICTNTGPTGGVSLGGSGYLGNFGQGSVGVIEYAMDFLIPAGKYLWTYNLGTNTSWSMKIFGYEI